MIRKGGLHVILSATIPRIESVCVNERTVPILCAHNDWDLALTAVPKSPEVYEGNREEDVNPNQSFVESWM